MEQEIDFKLTPEQIEAFQRLGEAMEKAYAAILEMVQATLEAIRKALEPLMRYWTFLRLLEWRSPFRIAKFISQKIPAWLAYDVGLRWFHARVHGLA